MTFTSDYVARTIRGRTKISNHEFSFVLPRTVRTTGMCFRQHTPPILTKRVIESELPCADF
jgi:hypothetical protein